MEPDELERRAREAVASLDYSLLLHGMVVLAQDMLSGYIQQDGNLAPVDVFDLYLVWELANRVLAEIDSPDTVYEFTVLEVARCVDRALETGVHRWLWLACDESGADEFEHAVGHSVHVKSLALALGAVLLESTGRLRL